MTPAEIRAARISLGLTPAEFASMLRTSVQTVYRMEYEPTRAGYRTPAVRMPELIAAWLDGHRPADWPKGRG